MRATCTCSHETVIFPNKNAHFWSFLALLFFFVDWFLFLFGWWSIGSRNQLAGLDQTDALGAIEKWSTYKGAADWKSDGFKWRHCFDNFMKIQNRSYFLKIESLLYTTTLYRLLFDSSQIFESPLSLLFLVSLFVSGQPSRRSWSNRVGRFVFDRIKFHLPAPGRWRARSLSSTRSMFDWCWPTRLTQS